MRDTETSLLLVMALAVYVVYRLLKLLLASRLKKRRVNHEASLLIAYYSYNRSLMGVTSTQTEELTITYFVAYGRELAHTDSLERAIRSDSEGTMMISVHLPFQTSSHLVGINQRGRQELGLQEFLARRKLEVIELEGDFPSTFLLYAPPGNQFNARYLFDPKAMAFVVDFCRSHHFEVVGDMLYITANNATEAADSEGDSFSTESIKQLVKEIKPALIIASEKSTSNPHRRIYGIPRAGMRCPTCQTKLEGSGGLHRCPKGHGVLLSGATLLKLKKPFAHQRALAEEELQKMPAHICPNCSNEMKPANYQQTGIVIDACIRCGYRWFDQGEDKLILGK